MTAKEQLRQVVDGMGEEEAVRVLQLLSSQREDLMAGSLAGAGVGDETVTVEGGRAVGGVRMGSVVRRRISIDALALGTRPFQAARLIASLIRGEDR